MLEMALADDCVDPETGEITPLVIVRVAVPADHRHLANCVAWIGFCCVSRNATQARILGISAAIASAIGALVLEPVWLMGRAVASEAGPQQAIILRGVHCVEFQPNGSYGLAGRSSYLGRYAVGGIDASGCGTYAYELLAPMPADFFAGPKFRPGVTAYEYGTVETTVLRDGRQLVSVVDPTPLWKSAYAGYDRCTLRSTAHGTEQVCSAPAVRQRSDDWPLYVPVGAALGGLTFFIVHNARPAGPIRRRRRFRRHHDALAQVAGDRQHHRLEPAEARRLARRITRLEKLIADELSETQHHWFRYHLATGRHGLALESLTRWISEKRLPVPAHLRQELDWLAASLHIQHVALPLVDDDIAVQDQCTAQTSTNRPGRGCDVPLESFRQLVAEALDSLPEEFARAMDNVAIVVEERAQDGRELFGIYIGVPLTNRRFRQWNVHPDKIIVYRQTICAYCRSQEEVRSQVYRTVIHEVAHHFGIGDPRLEELGWG